MSGASVALGVRSRPAVLTGVAAGLLGAAAMAMFAMIAAATYHGTGFFTPMYHIASSVLSAGAMMTSVAQAEAGNAFYFDAGPALFGLLMHMSVGAVFGAIFPLVGRLVGARGAAWIPLGIVYGLAVLAVMAFVGLPLTAAVLGGGDPIADMPAMAGWWTFTIEHLLFGSVLGLVFASRGESSA